MQTLNHRLGNRRAGTQNRHAGQAFQGFAEIQTLGRSQFGTGNRFGCLRALWLYRCCRNGDFFECIFFRL